ncbi:MAG: efflux RND transporter periplasmic adaptor subunit [Clostridiaceae bacterium]|nr:efflux RND transporter periplasmic adaptor subunit [Clostridiaceae bacterium]
MKSIKKTGKIVILFCVCAIALSAVVLVISQTKNAGKTQEIAYKETNVEFGNLTVGVTESGSVSIGAVTQSYDLTVGSAAAVSAVSNSNTGASSGAGNSGSQSSSMGGSSTAAASSSSSSSSGTASALSLVVESVSAAAGQVVKTGDPLMKLTDESITTARAALTASAASAELALKQAIIDRDKAKLQAEYEYEANKALGSTAQSSYQATLDSLDLAISSAEKSIEETSTRIGEIPDEIAVLQAKLDALSEQEAAGSTGSDLNRQIEALDTELADAQDKYEMSTAQLAQAKRNKITQSITAKEQYDQNILTYQNADELYKIALDGIDAGVDSATDTLESAQVDLQDFEQFVGDGTILAACSGTITAIGYEAGDTLAASTALATYQDAAAVSLTVSVAQDDISAVAVGDQVNIEFTAYQDTVFQGSVTAISATTTTSRSTTTVSYPVTVLVEGDVSAIYAGMTGNVTFITKEIQNVLYVSNKAITTEGTKSYVKKKEKDGSTTTVEVTTGFSDGYQVEIQSGLAEGDTVLIESRVTAS